MVWIFFVMFVNLRHLHILFDFFFPSLLNYSSSSRCTVGLYSFDFVAMCKGVMDYKLTWDKNFTYNRIIIINFITDGIYVGKCERFTSLFRKMHRTSVAYATETVHFRYVCGMYSNYLQQLWKTVFNNIFLFLCFFC